ncbi:hypothetical protein POM88_041599 [Heracleum sosnowskyi]|uniref:Uncharacterized protein n=1 Tax=Heracleum sosnowskyi TaxID=360622 RepID=A0AAD8HG82_9APIA|nr:hypothetical protein POM88_041599 [Heracleum sosnowskyi]
MATTTLLNTQSTSSTPSLPLTIFSLISIASALSALSFFSTSTFYNTYLVSYTYFFPSAFIAFHLIFFFFHQNLRNARILQGGLIKYTVTPAMFFGAFDLYFVPEKTVNGLLFVICIWVDVHALIQIVRPVKQVKYLPHLIFMVIVDRAMNLYGFTITYWKIMFFCFIIMCVTDIFGNRIFASSHNEPDETKEVTE